MMSKEKELYELIELLDQDNLDYIGVHESAFAGDDTEGYRIYHSDGYCVEVIRTKDYQTEKEMEEGKLYYWYEYDDNIFDGFKPCSVERFIDIIKRDGVFK